MGIWSVVLALHAQRRITFKRIHEMLSACERLHTGFGVKTTFSVNNLFVVQQDPSLLLAWLALTQPVPTLTSKDCGFSYGKYTMRFPPFNHLFLDHQFWTRLRMSFRTYPTIVHRNSNNKFQDLGNCETQ